MSTIPSSPTTAAFDAVPTIGQLSAMLLSAVGLLNAVGAALGQMAVAGQPELLTAEEFAQRLGGGVKTRTVEDWCREGRFPLAKCWGRAGWRIPSFYLTRASVPAHLEAWFEQMSVGTVDQEGQAPAQVDGRATSGSAAAVAAQSSDTAPGVGEDQRDESRIVAQGTRHQFDLGTMDVARRLGASNRPKNVNSSKSQKGERKRIERQRIPAFRDATQAPPSHGDERSGRNDAAESS